MTTQVTLNANDWLDQVETLPLYQVRCEGWGVAYDFGDEHVCPECHCSNPATVAMNCPDYRRTMGANASTERVELVTGYRFDDYERGAVLIYEVGPRFPRRVAKVYAPEIYTPCGNDWDLAAMEAVTLARAGAFVEALTAELAVRA